MRRVKFLMLKISFAKVFKYIHKHENIRFEIKVAIITNSFTVEGIRNIKRVLLIRIADFFIIQLNKTLIWEGVVFQRSVRLKKYSRKDKLPFV